MNKKDFIRGNRNASVVYSSKDINGEKTQSLVINGKEVDLTNPDDVQEAKDYFESFKKNPFTRWFKLFGFDADDLYDNAIQALEEKHQKALETKKDNEGFDWSIVPWEDQAWTYADDYLLNKFGDEYDKLSDEEQYRMLKTVAESFEWLLDKKD